MTRGRYWDSSRLKTDLAWLPTATTGGMAQVFQIIGFGLIRDHVITYVIMGAPSVIYEPSVIDPLRDMFPP